MLLLSSDRAERPHLHVQRDESLAKFWIAPIVLARNQGFSRRELREIESVILDNVTMFLERWNEFFGS